jgi:hypothetical protein
MFDAPTLLAGLTQMPECWLRLLYPLVFLILALARSQGLLLQTDITHKPVDLIESAQAVDCKLVPITGDIISINRMLISVVTLQS